MSESITPVENSEKSNSVSLTSKNDVESILTKISEGESVNLDIDKELLLNNFNTFMLTEAFSQLATISKLHKIQTRCLDTYYDQVNELLDNEDANVFLLDKIINTINNSIDRCNNIIMKLGLNADISDQLTINKIDNSQTINVYQSQISKQKVVNTIDKILSQLNNSDLDVVDVEQIEE